MWLCMATLNIMYLRAWKVNKDSPGKQIYWDIMLATSQVNWKLNMQINIRGKFPDFTVHCFPQIEFVGKASNVCSFSCDIPAFQMQTSELIYVFMSLVHWKTEWSEYTRFPLTFQCLFTSQFIPSSNYALTFIPPSQLPGIEFN